MKQQVPEDIARSKNTKHKITVETTKKQKRTQRAPVEATRKKERGRSSTRKGCHEHEDGEIYEIVERIRRERTETSHSEW